MKVIKGNFGEVRICDCFDKTYGLPSLKDKQFDLFFSDVPWGHEFDGTKSLGANKILYDKPKKVNYEDSFNPKFNLKYYKEVRRISNGSVIITGKKALFWWIRNTEPLELFIFAFKNGVAQSKISTFNGLGWWICYGDFFKKHKFHRNYETVTDIEKVYGYETYIENGFLANNKEYEYIHPSPKDYKTWNKAISDLKPTNMIDIFAGSGTLAEVGESLGIPYVCFEIENRYIPDIKYRIDQGIERYKKLQKKVFKPKNIRRL